MWYRWKLHSSLGPQFGFLNSNKKRFLVFHISAIFSRFSYSDLCRSIRSGIRTSLYTTTIKVYINKAKPKQFLERTIGFTINYRREDENDPREFSEFLDIRLWFVRLDTMYPWLPVLLDWRGGELARYAAMLVPHQMSMRMGVVFNPEALELFVV